MTKKLNEKYNDSCVKLFEFIKMLYEGEVEFKKVIEHFSDGKYDGTSNTHVTLNKYLNAMKIFGIKVKKIKGKYRLLSPLYRLQLNDNDIKSINILKNACKELPNGKNKNNCEEFIRALEIRCDSTDVSQIPQNNTDNLHFYNSKTVNELVKRCELYCQENFKVEVCYTNEEGEETNLLGSPLELIYQKRRIFLKVLGTNGCRVYEIPMEKIITIKQISASISSTSIPTTIVYRIKNRLAKNYNIRDWERIETVESDGSKIIINKNEDFDLLLNRLMRYGKECEIVSPKFLKEQMINLINKTLSNYQ